VGHSVLTADLSFCSQRAVRDWILGNLSARPTCRRVAPVAKVLATFPRRPATRSIRSTLAVAGRAVREAEATWLQVLFSPSSFTPRGIYGGRLVAARDGEGFTLTRYSIAPGVFVSGTFRLVDTGPPFAFAGTLRVTGSAAVAGTLSVSTDNRITGTLGGRRVSGGY
jgi:hypothetical protein